jgi:hypothetical protein
VRTSWVRRKPSAEPEIRREWEKWRWVSCEGEGRVRIGLPVVVLCMRSSGAVVAVMRECELFGWAANVTMADVGDLCDVRGHCQLAKGCAPEIPPVHATLGPGADTYTRARYCSDL